MTACAPEQAQLKSDAIGFVDALVIGLAATSPAYSLAAGIGPIAALVGVYAPGVLLASFVPMMLIATAFLYLNRVDQDCGTTPLRLVYGAAPPGGLSEEFKRTATHSSSWAANPPPTRSNEPSRRASKQRSTW